MKKLLLFIALTIFGLGLNAQSITIDYDGYSLEFSVVYHGNCYVSSYSGTPVDVTIPPTVTISGTEYSVTSIGGFAFSLCSSLTSIEIPNSVTSIGEGAFQFCSSLTSIVIPNSITSIGESTFAGCSSLTSIEIPNSVTSIGYVAFSYCSSLTSIVVAESNTVYDSRENSNAIIETSSNTLIAGCQNTVIPNSVTSIGYRAFSGSSSPTSIEIPNSVTYIGDEAFWLSSSLTSVRFGDNSQLTSIGEYAFSGCSSLTSIEIPNSVTYIGGGAFGGCSSFTSIEIPNSITSIGNVAFGGCSSLTSIEIPNSVTYIGDEAFARCSSLSVIKCDAENVPETEYSAFDGCPLDMTIYVPRNLVHKYKGTDPWSNYIITGAPKVAVSANNKNYGTAEGGGLYDLGEKVTVKAIANPYCYFINWTENDNVVSTDAEYAFYINSDRNLVANFAKISVPENIEELSSAINIYPNPVENELFLATEVRVEEIAIYDVYGRLCCRDASNASTSNASTSNSMDTFNVSVQDLEAGVYFVKVVTSEGEIVKRFVKN